MRRLSVYLFGNMRIEFDGVNASQGLTPNIQDLLAYLLLYRRRTHSRDVLANLFWGDHPQERARNCLNTAIWRLRRILEPEGIQPGTYLISTSTGEVGFNATSNFWLDVAAFEEDINPNLSCPIQDASSSQIESLIQIIKLYTSDLLEGHYSDWILCERERLRIGYLDGLYRLMCHFYAVNDFPKTLIYGRQILNCDPLREDVHRQIMRAYMKNGQRALAVKQYNHCCEMLTNELGITPMAETQQLFKQILEGGSTSIPATLEQELTKLQPLAQLYLAMESLEVARKNLQQLIETLGMDSTAG